MSRLLWGRDTLFPEHSSSTPPPKPSFPGLRRRRPKRDPMSPQERRAAAMRLLAEPIRWLSPADWDAWKPLIGHRGGDEYRFRYDFLPFNRAYFNAYAKGHMSHISEGRKRAASIGVVDDARSVLIRDKDGRVTSEKPATTNSYSPMLARVFGRLYPELPVGYADEFPEGEEPYLEFRSPAMKKGAFTDWLEDR